MKLSRHLAIFQALIIFFSTFGFSKTFAEERSGSIQETAENASGPLNLSLVPFANGFSGPLGAIGADDGRIFVLEQNGIIKIVQSDGTVLATPFLDIQTRVDSSSNEEGLLGMALDPDFDSNGFFYLNYTYTDTNRISRISRFGLTADPNVADPASEEVLLTIDQPASNHNAGGILFGPDGYLYIPMGDGGGAPGTRPQDLSLLLGKVIRIDVSRPGNGTANCEGGGTGNYAVPADNPFVDGTGGNCDEIWALGLRNPWQSSFDQTTGDLYIGDVGQNAKEEINFQPASSSGGENYGWPCYEGNSPYNTDGCAPAGNYDFPIFDYAHFSTSCTSVTGGYVYRGTQFPDMFGHYIFTDYCQGVFWDLVPDGSGGWNSTEHTNLTGFGYSAFGEDSSGELYVTHIGNGTLYHLQEENSPPPPPADSLCVEDIQMNLQSFKSNRGAQADVTVTDCAGNPVEDVVVSGLWETPTSSSPLNTPNSTTDDSGIATSASPTVRKKDSGQFIYYVLNVEKPELTYDFENSVESGCINTDGSSCTAEPPPPPPPPGDTAHVGAMGGGSSSSSGNKWNAMVTLTIEKDSNDDPYPDVTVSGTWSNGASGSGSCQTGVDGMCSISKNNLKGRAGNSVTFTVNDISDDSGSIYNSSANDVSPPSIDIPKPPSASPYRTNR